MMWVNVQTHSVLSPEFSILRKRKDKAIEAWNGYDWLDLDRTSRYGTNTPKAFRTFEGAQAALKFIRKERL